MRDYQLHEQSTDDFEMLVVLLCRELLGIATVNFAEGKDGGRDARFHGSANAYPSKNSPWTGKFIIQAKHTSNPIASCSDSDFYTQLKKELPKIRKLRVSGEVDNYLLFTNRKLTGGADANHLKEIENVVGTPNVIIIGKETMNSYLSTYTDVARLMNLRAWQEPIRIRNEDIQHLIEAFQSSGFNFKNSGESALSFDMVGLEEKNAKNNLSILYFEYMEQSSRPYFYHIDKFLENPINQEYTEFYYHIVDEFNKRLIIEKPNYPVFDAFLVALYDAILDKIPALKSRSGFLSLFIHYMYAHCDLGRK